VRDERIERLLAWLAREGVDLSYVAIDFLDHGERTGRAIRPIAIDDHVIRIPLRLMMSAPLAAASPVGRRIAAAKRKVHAQSTLAAFLLAEDRDAKSAWRPFLDSLPRSFEHHPLLFDARRLALLRGSTVPGRIAALRRSIAHDHAVIAAAVPQLADLTIAELTWARIVVMTRCFGVRIDGKRTHSLVPLVDMLNHSETPQVRSGYDAQRAEFLVRAARDCDAGQELHGFYGERCNSRFLLGYGFALEDNPENEADLVFADPLGGDPRSFSVRANVADAQVLLSFLRAACANQAERDTVPRSTTPVPRGHERWIAPIGSRNERAALRTIIEAAGASLARYETTIEQDDELLADPSLDRIDRACIILRRGEKKVLGAYLDLAHFALPFLRLGRVEFLRAAERYAPVGTFVGTYVRSLAFRVPRDPDELF
jgi:histone-lysine N-methyltransferase SETD3